jgi:hypothetical protein
VCVLYTLDGRRDWETTLVEGALRHAGIEVAILAPGDLLPADGHVLSVGLTPCLGTRQHGLDPGRVRPVEVLAGRAVTRAHLHDGLRPGENQVLIYGEPYDLLVRLAAGELAIDALRCRAVLGPLFDVAAYTAPPGGPLLTSLGCEKACAYCAFGATYRRLYGRRFGRRERPWLAMAAEIAERVARGEAALAFMADQFLATDPDQNTQLAGLVGCQYRMNSP